MLILLVFLPLLGAALSGLFPRYLGEKGVMVIPTAFCFISLVLSVVLLYDSIQGESYVIHLATWLKTSFLEINWALKLRNLVYEF